MSLPRADFHSLCRWPSAQQTGVYLWPTEHLGGTEGHCCSLLTRAGWTFTCPWRAKHPVPTLTFLPTFHQRWLKCQSRKSRAREAFSKRTQEGCTKRHNGSSRSGDPVHRFGVLPALRDREFYSPTESC